ncbi:MAG: VOC family protein [Anaerolineae bacterium]|nr:VOC family protein [Anaerolineae bacterium]
MSSTQATTPNYKTKIGHAHLKVRNLDQAINFYTTFFDLHIIERIGDHYAFLSGGEFHHEIALQNVGSMASAAPSHGVGLYHIAFEVPDKHSFALAYQALTEAGISVGIVDHLISWAMYFNDPDGNGLEIYWDTRHEPGGQQLWHGRNLPLSDDQVLGVLSK